MYIIHIKKISHTFNFRTAFLKRSFTGAKTLRLKKFTCIVVLTILLTNAIIGDFLNFIVTRNRKAKVSAIKNCENEPRIGIDVVLIGTGTLG